MAYAGVASAVAVQRCQRRWPACDAGHFRPLQELWASSIGLGTYLGEADDPTDARLAEAIRAAVSLGGNVLDTAINYRSQRSERTIGATLAALIAEGAVSREEIILCTKGGYLPVDDVGAADPRRDAAQTVLDAGWAAPEEIVAGCHCLAPAYLDHALTTSLANLRVQTVDVYYLHNPEQQLDVISRATLEARLEAACARLEQRAQEGRLRYYGVATWNGLRGHPASRGYLCLEALVQLAERVGGRAHHFRVVQLPYNLAMPEAFSFRNQPVHGEPLTLLEAAERLGVSVVVSASLLQGRLTRLPASVEAYLPHLSSAAQRAVQFARSTPGVTTALVGMKQRAHVEEILALAQQPPLAADQVARLFDRTRK
jgi:aryl-alcohol dehydrogenase-like predicted oxidoreductase